MTRNIFVDASTASLVSVREVAALSGTTVAAVNRCVDRGVVHPARPGRERWLDHQAAYFMVLKDDLDETGLSPAMCRTLFNALRSSPDNDLPHRQIRLSRSLRVDASSLVDVVSRTRRYLDGRERYIDADPEIKGGVPVIRETRIDVYSVQQRLDAGETVQQLEADYPEIPAEAFETAAFYAKTHPRRGRPSTGRPAAA
jgi:uncharacterized protein (DUF433 family)